MAESESDSDGELPISNDLVDLPDYKAPGTTTLNFGGVLDPPLKLYEDLTEGCGGQLWPAGFVLANYLLREPLSQMLKHKRM